MDIRCFFIMLDQIKTKGIQVNYCPTSEMIAHYLTKSLQSSLFQKFWNMVAGIVEENIMKYKYNYIQEWTMFGVEES